MGVALRARGLPEALLLVLLGLGEELVDLLQNLVLVTTPIAQDPRCETDDPGPIARRVVEEDEELPEHRVNESDALQLLLGEAEQQNAPVLLQLVRF